MQDGKLIPDSEYLFLQIYLSLSPEKEFSDIVANLLKPKLQNVDLEIYDDDKLL